jgi:hypothetical protein
VRERFIVCACFPVCVSDLWCMHAFLCVCDICGVCMFFCVCVCVYVKFVVYECLSVVRNEESVCESESKSTCVCMRVC